MIFIIGLERALEHDTPDPILKLRALGLQSGLPGFDLIFTGLAIDPMASIGPGSPAALPLPQINRLFVITMDKEWAFRRAVERFPLCRKLNRHGIIVSDRLGKALPIRIEPRHDLVEDMLAGIIRYGHREVGRIERRGQLFALR